MFWDLKEHGENLNHIQEGMHRVLYMAERICRYCSSDYQKYATGVWDLPESQRERPRSAQSDQSDSPLIFPQLLQRANVLKLS